MTQDEAFKFVDALEVRAIEGHGRTDVNGGIIRIDPISFQGREYYDYTLNGREMTRLQLIQALTLVELPEPELPQGLLQFLQDIKDQPFSRTPKTSGIWPMV